MWSLWTLSPNKQADSICSLSEPKEPSSDPSIPSDPDPSTRSFRSRRHLETLGRSPRALFDSGGIAPTARQQRGVVGDFLNDSPAGRSGGHRNQISSLRYWIRVDSQPQRERETETQRETDRDRESLCPPSLSLARSVCVSFSVLCVSQCQAVWSRGGTRLLLRETAGQAKGDVERMEV